MAPGLRQRCRARGSKAVRVAVIAAQQLSRVRLFAASWTAARHAPPSSTISQTLLRFMFMESGMPSSHLILCRPLLLPP